MSWSQFAKLDVWHLLNLDTGEQLDGRFPAEDLTRTFGSRWAEQFALNRKNSIIQFLHGESETVSFTGTLFRRNFLENIEPDLVVLERMATRDRLLARPPVLQFWVGDSFLNMRCVMQPTTVNYEIVDVLGGIMKATFAVTLTKYTPFSVDEIGLFDTRYHRARTGDYLEMLAWHEYGAPLIGVELAKRHPTIQLAPTQGEVVKLPSVEGLRRVRITPASIVFSGLTERTDSPQKTRMRSLLQSRGRSKLSKVLQG